MSEKITFDKLKNKEVPLKIKAFQLNGETIEVKEYLPINDNYCGFATSRAERVSVCQSSSNGCLYYT